MLSGDDIGNDFGSDQQIDPPILRIFSAKMLANSLHPLVEFISRATVTEGLVHLPTAANSVGA